MFKFIFDGYKNLIVYEEASKLRALIFKITKDFPKTELRRVGQMTAAARSIKQNIAEGYKYKTIPQFRRFLKMSSGSAAELDEDINDCYEDGLIDKKIFKELSDLSKRIKSLLDGLIKSLE